MWLNTKTDPPGGTRYLINVFSLSTPNDKNIVPTAICVCDSQNVVYVFVTFYISTFSWKTEINTTNHVVLCLLSLSLSSFDFRLWLKCSSMFNLTLKLSFEFFFSIQNPLSPTDVCIILRVCEIWKCESLNEYSLHDEQQNNKKQNQITSVRSFCTLPLRRLYQNMIPTSQPKPKYSGRISMQVTFSSCEKKPRWIFGGIFCKISVVGCHSRKFCKLKSSLSIQSHSRTE